MIQVRKEEEKDWDDVRLVNVAAFGQPDEGHIVDKLRSSGKKTLSLVAICENTVLGHETYYPRFGFQRASRYQLKCQWEGVPDEAFMVIILNRAAMQGVSGVVKYGDEFNEAM